MTDAVHADSTDEFESRILAFERAWHGGQPPSISEFLPPFGLPTERLRLLHELVSIDLESRWRQAVERDRSPQPPLLDDYVRRFPELGSLDELPLELIEEEYRVRQRWGDRPSREEFLVRFPGRREELAIRLPQIDRELDEESDDAPEQSLPVRPDMSNRNFDGRPDPRAPLAYSDYVLQRLIGAGRMGKVYRAWQRSLDRPVAVKYLRKLFLHEAEAVERFITEARTVARLRHLGIIPVHGLGRTPGGGYFIVMDWIDGPDLARVIQSRGPAAVADAVRWTMEACAAIEEAHRHGVVHCDLKPGNILLGHDGRVRVTDFGLARSLTDETRTDEGIEGTAPFMAPEQVFPAWGPISPRTDVYGLGAVLYTLLTGRPPWNGRTLADVLAQVVSAAPATSPDELRPGIPVALLEICLRCLSKPAEQRFPTIRELYQALGKCSASSRMAD